MQNTADTVQRYLNGIGLKPIKKWYPAEEYDSDTRNLNRLATELNGRGIPTDMEYTGGGFYCATIYSAGNNKGLEMGFYGLYLVETLPDECPQQIKEIIWWGDNEEDWTEEEVQQYADAAQNALGLLR